MPETSSSLLSLTRIGTWCSIRCLRYLISSKVVSGAREPLLLLPPCLAVTLAPAALFRNCRNAAVSGFCLGLTIIAVARCHPQIRTPHFDLEFVKFFLRQRHVFRVESQQILSAEFFNYVADRLVQCGTRRRRQYAAARPLCHGGERILAAHVAAD